MRTREKGFVKARLGEAFPGQMNSRNLDEMLSRVVAPSCYPDIFKLQKKFTLTQTKELPRET